MRFCFFSVGAPRPDDWSKQWEFPDPLGRQQMSELPFSEIVLIDRLVKVGELHTYLSDVALSDIRDPLTPTPKTADGKGRSPQRLVVDVVVRRGGERRRVIAQGRDIYAFTAPLVCEAVERLLNGGFHDVGADRPGAIFDAREFVSALTPDHLTFDIITV